MNLFKTLGVPAGKAICYSGYRDGQSPESRIYPSYEQIKEDLLILQNHWSYLRLYDCSLHAETVLKVIEQEQLNFKVMLGAYIGAELNNFGCPWGRIFSEVELENNAKDNLVEIKKLIRIGNQYPDIVFALSAGNEATVDWTDHFVSVDKVISYVRMIKEGAMQPVTFCENYIPWYDKLKLLVEEVDFISIHTYPVWEYKKIHEALEYTRQNYYGIADRYPGKPVIITEAGWATNSNGRGIDPENVSQEFQATYYNNLMEWSEKEGIMTFFFEAFDEPWKGSPEALEPEKHWGIFTVDRKPKKVMRTAQTNRQITNQ
jgi:exo-beta-1,3-glucanase (GH17 family)